VPRRLRSRRDAGTVTAELAAVLPVLVLVLAVALSAVAVAASRVRLQDAAREAARLAARGDPAAARRLAEQTTPGARIELTATDGEIVAVVRATVHPLTGLLPGFELAERAVAAVEPSAASP
jgi:Flp pilus assembly protein TadG